MSEYKGNPYPVGYFFGREKPFKRMEMQFAKGDMLYMTTDGFVEQFGGPHNKLFGKKRFRQIIDSSYALSMEDQKEEFHRAFKNWKMDQKQTDDVCLMGIRV